MPSFQRYAVYYLPHETPLASFGAEWLGWDVATGHPVTQPHVDFDLNEVTRTPRKYGFHGTLKPPFRLAEGKTADDLFAAVEALAATTRPVIFNALDVSAIGSFLALTPTGNTDDLARLAGRIVTELDVFRAPPSEAELMRRRAARLNSAQEGLLMKWGYPYVLEEFRFHLTLTGRLDPATLAVAKNAALELLPDLPKPFPVETISIVGERSDGMFEAVRHYPLTG